MSIPTGAGSRPISRVRSLAYNTKLVPPAQAPRSYADLLEPRFKGKFAWNPNSVSGAYGFIGTVLKHMGEEKGIAYLRALAKQDITPVPMAIRAVLDRVIAGEYAIGLEMNGTHAHISAAHGRAGRLGAARSGQPDPAGRRHHRQGAAPERGAAVPRFHDLARRPGGVPRPRLHPDASGRTGQESAAQARDRRLQGGRLQPRGSRRQCQALGQIFQDIFR